ncbi:MAG TPA: hypothetical protein DCR83_01825 [Eubacterium sp.]|jgi:murein DD-endopeptidase MepM/ murein hydrolase activator NlpD|nr:hypothetical protein [Eubacterium sp.]HCO35790.1 hypothetical protein [Eubacterium sp.]
MERLSRYGRRMKLTLINTMTVASLVCIIAIPFLTKNLLKTEANYYSITINGMKVGAANTEEEVIVALASARQELSAQYNEVVYMDPDIEINKEGRTVAQRMSVDELSGAIYSYMFDNVMDVDFHMYYTVRFGDFVVTLDSKDSVIALFEKLIAKYDPNNAFTVSLDIVDAATGTYGISINEKATESTAAEIVSSAISGTAVSQDGETVANGDGLTGISFDTDVVIVEVPADNAVTTTVDEAYENITKEHAEKTIYTVETGDTLSVIAQNNGLSMSELLSLNSNLSENSVIAPGDSITVTVPKSEISVITKYQMTYEEDYEAEPNYQDDDTNYRGTNTVISEGTTGHRAVTAEVTYSNGNETGRTYIKEDIIKESIPKTIAVGTLTPPTYLKPISGGSFSSGFGYRWGSLHKGVDWSVSQGTTVTAAAAGTVTRAGWFADYGYCVDITHSNGTMTRYGHLSSIKVSVGQSVTQGQAIAASGNTGYSTGPHLHFEIWVGGVPVNPLNYVNKN